MNKTARWFFGVGVLPAFPRGMWILMAWLLAGPLFLSSLGMVLSVAAYGLLTCFLSLVEKRRTATRGTA